MTLSVDSEPGAQLTVELISVRPPSGADLTTKITHTQPGALLEINSTENFDADRPWQNYLQRLTAKR